MDTTSTIVPIRSHDRAVRTALLVDAALWLATGASTRIRELYSDNGGDDWEGPYALFSVLLLIAAAAGAVAVTMYTSRPGGRSAGRIAAIALIVLATLSTVVAWAFPVWAVLLAAGFAAIAATGSAHGRNAWWLSTALLIGLAVAIIGVTAKIGPPGSHNDYSEAQGWGVTVACALAAAVLAILSRRD